jgi:pSer/pThr/pTyr-binding forkhead associated (FHA) protein
MAAGHLTDQTTTDTPPTPRTTDGAADDSVRARLVLASGGQADAASPAAAGRDEEFVLIGDVVVIGSAPGADVRLADERVAPMHAEIHRLSGDRFEFVQRAGTAAAMVNGEVRQRAMLSDSYRIELGGSMLIFRNDRGLEPELGGEGAGAVDTFRLGGKAT